MARRLTIQSPEGLISRVAKRGAFSAFPGNAATYTGSGIPVNGLVGYAPGCIWHNDLCTTLGQYLYLNIGTQANSLWTPLDALLLAGLARQQISTAITTAGAGTLTAAAIVGGVIVRSGPTAAFSDTTDTAAAIIAAMPQGATTGMSWLLTIVNTSAWPETVIGGTSVTLSGLTAVVGANSTSTWLVTMASATTVTMQLLESTYNNALGYDPSTVATQFGSGTGTFLEEGNLYRYADGTGVQAAATAADKVVLSYTLPANSLDGVGFRGLYCQFSGDFATNGNTKQCKIIFNPSTATVGSTVGSGGTVIADTGASTGSNVGWVLEGQVYKYGAANSNTQVTQELSTIVGTTHGGCAKHVNATATENAAIFVAFTINCTTATTDATGYAANINALN
jgi:hypothetical protein